MFLSNRGRMAARLNLLTTVFSCDSSVLRRSVQAFWFSNDRLNLKDIVVCVKSMWLFITSSQSLLHHRESRHCPRFHYSSFQSAIAKIFIQLSFSFHVLSELTCTRSDSTILCSVSLTRYSNTAGKTQESMKQISFFFFGGAFLSVAVEGLRFHIFVVMQFSLGKDDYNKDTDRWCTVYRCLLPLMAWWSHDKTLGLTVGGLPFSSSLITRY